MMRQGMADQARTKRLPPVISRKKTQALTAMMSMVTKARPRGGARRRQGDEAAHYMPPLPSRMPMP